MPDPTITVTLSRELVERKPVRYDRERFTVAICPACGGSVTQTYEQREAGGTYCYCKVDGTTKGDPTRCEEIGVVALAALALDSPQPERYTREQVEAAARAIAEAGDSVLPWGQMPETHSPRIQKQKEALAARTREHCRLLARAALSAAFPDQQPEEDQK